MTVKLDNRLAFVTGVTSGIGLATARKLCAAGARVIGLGRNAAQLQALAADLGPAFEPLLADLSTSDGRARAVAHVEKLEPGPHLLINNAAACSYDSPLEIEPAQLDALLEVNVVAPIALARAAATRMTEGAHILQLSSVTAQHIPNSKFASYASTKHSVEILTRALRWDLAPRGISVSVLSPGLVETPIYDKVSGFERTREKLRASLPQWLSADDVADSIIWMVTRPAHLTIGEMTLLPRGQGR